MITPSQEYYNKLWLLQSPNIPHLALLVPSTETIYKINLNNRTIESPPFISVELDHKSEIIYFSVDRYYDAMDLADTNCIIQYTNTATKKSGFYAVPFYDVVTLSAEKYINDKGQEEYVPKILFPWCIDGLATEKAGTLEYSIKFYKVGDDNKIIYNLNTLPAKTQILKTLNPVDNTIKIPDASAFEWLLDRVNQITKDEYELYWETLE